MDICLRAENYASLKVPSGKTYQRSCMVEDWEFGRNKMIALVWLKIILAEAQKRC